MGRYLLNRFAATLVTLWVIASLTFALMHAVPGGPFSSEKKVPPAVLRNLEAKYGLDKPLWEQYTTYMGNLLRWDFGPSFKYESQTVNQIINRGFPISATLGSLAIGVALIGGISAGVISALRHYKWQDHVAMLIATIGFSVPSFILAGLLQHYLVYTWKLKLFGVAIPGARWGTWAHAIMPTIALAALPMAFIARLVRSSLLEVFSQDYMKTARAKGLPGYVVVYKHAIRNALLPVVTYLGPLAAGTLTGSFVIEHIFAIPGIGRDFVGSIGNRDYTLIMGTTMFYSVLLVAANFAVDLLYAIVDPRIKVMGGGD